MTFFATNMKYVKGATPDKSTMAESRKQKFAHVYENGRDFSESLKKRLTSLKKFIVWTRVRERSWATSI